MERDTKEFLIFSLVVIVLTLLALSQVGCNEPEKPPMTCADMAIAVCDSFDACGEPTEDCELIVAEICDEWPEPCQQEVYECSVVESGTWWHCLREVP